MTAAVAGVFVWMMWFVLPFSSRRAISRSSRLCSTTQSTASSQKSIGIVGGGLAGLSLAHHLLEMDDSVCITIYDPKAVGQGGASAVAGGLVHPLSPRGKLVHWGLEGLEATNRLLDKAAMYAPECILRNHIYRVALTDKNVKDLRQTVVQLPDYCQWMEKKEMDKMVGSNSLGGLKLFNGCRVIHVPTYLKGLYTACCNMGTMDWQVSLELNLDNHDHVVYAGGAGMLQDEIVDPSLLPIDLVRGQSLELTPTNPVSYEAALCGKYTSPLPEDRMLVGASHEFGVKALSEEDLYNELKAQSYDLAPSLWDHSTVHRVTSGWRVQSRRGALGRLPIVGPLSDKEWIFTGLSSRGLLYHGIYGKKLAGVILNGDSTDAHLSWWKK